MKLGSRNLRFWTSAKNMTPINKNSGRYYYLGGESFVIRVKRLYKHDLRWASQRTNMSYFEPQSIQVCPTFGLFGALGVLSAAAASDPRRLTDCARRCTWASTPRSEGQLFRIPRAPSIPTPPHVRLLRALWPLIGAIWGVLKGSWGVLV